MIHEKGTLIQLNLSTSRTGVIVSSSKFQPFFDRVYFCPMVERSMRNELEVESIVNGRTFTFLPSDLISIDLNKVKYNVLTLVDEKVILEIQRCVRLIMDLK